MPAETSGGERTQAEEAGKSSGTPNDLKELSDSESSDGGILHEERQRRAKDLAEAERRAAAAAAALSWQPNVAIGEKKSREQIEKLKKRQQQQGEILKQQGISRMMPIATPTPKIQADIAGHP